MFNYFQSESTVQTFPYHTPKFGSIREKLYLSTEFYPPRPFHPLFNIFGKKCFPIHTLVQTIFCTFAAEKA